MAVQITMKLTIWTKNKRNAYISLDEIEWGVLPVRTLRHLFPFGDEIEISQAETEQLKEELGKNAWAMLVEYLAKAEHSAEQSRRYLMRHKFHNSIIETCVKLALEKKYIDDSRFAEIYINSYFERGKSKRYILQKLFEYGIDMSVAERLIEQNSDEIQTAAHLKNYILRLKYKHQNEEAYKMKEKVFSSLYRRGFTMDEIGPVWDALERDDD